MSIFGSSRGSGSGGGSQQQSTGSVTDPVGSPVVGAPLLLTGTFSERAYVQLVRAGVNDGPRVPASVLGGVWQATVTPSSGGAYVAQLWSAQSGGRLLDTSAAFVAVVATSAPVLTDGQTVTLAEDTATTTVLRTIAFTGGTPTSWSITAGNTGAKFAISNAGVLSLAGALDYETLASYTLTIQGTNSGGSDTTTVAVTVTDVLDTVPVVTGSQTFSVSESAVVGTVVGTVAVTGGTTASFSIQSGNTGNAFAISNAGIITIAAALDFGTLPAYTLGIRATNAVGNSATVSVGVTVLVASPTDTVVQMTVEGTGAGADAVSWFAHAFVQGDIPQGTAILARRGDTDAELRTQVEVLQLWPDNTIKHALIAVELPSLADTTTLAINLVKNDVHSSPGSALDMAALLGARSASITITPTGGGTPQTVDLISLLGVSRWRQGPLVSESRVTQAINSSAIGGTTATARLVADLIIAKDGTFCVDFSVRNDASGVTGTGTLSYSISVAVDNQVLYSASNIVQTVSKVFSRRVFSKTGGGAAITRPYWRHDTGYLARTGAVMNYDQTSGVSASAITYYTNLRAGANWNVPLHERLLGKAMAQTGDHEYIGVNPEWNAAWLLSYHRVVQDMCNDMVEAAFGIPWHYWDYADGTRYCTPRSHPGVGSHDADPKLIPVNGDATWALDVDHHPCSMFVPWLLTGRRACMDGLMGEASGSLFNVSMYGRGNTYNETTGMGVMVQGGGIQMRGTGWALRTMYYAAAWVPLALQPYGGFYDTALRTNFRVIVSRIPAWQADEGEIYGIMHPNTNGGGLVQWPQWQWDYYFQPITLAAMAGYDDAEIVCDWLAHFGCGRLLHPNDWNPADNTQYSISIGTNNSFVGPPFFQTWAAMKAGLPPVATYGPDPPNFLGQNGNTYQISLIQSMAAYRNFRPQDANAARAWRWCANTTMPNCTEAAVTSNYKKFAGVPFNQTWHAGTAPTVDAAQAYDVLEATGVGTAACVVQTSGGFVASFAITGGNTNSDWTIDNAGVLTPANALNKAITAAYSLSITATNATGTSAPVVVTVNIVDSAPVAPTVTSGLAFTIAQNATQYTTLGTATTSAGTPTITWSITGGNTGGAWEIDSSSGVIRQALVSLDWVTTPSYSLTVQATNSAGSDSDTVSVTPLAAPVVTPGQTFDVIYSAANGSTAGTVATTGGIPTAFAITSGNTNSAFAISSGGVITKQATLTAGASFTLTIRASNTYGSDTNTVSITVADEPEIPYGVSDTTCLGIYALRKVVGNYAGSCIRVRRSSDDTEQDIGFTGGSLNASALTSFVGANQGFVTKWYDQSGNGNDMLHPTAGKQPHITNSGGTIYTLAGTNARYGVRFDNSRSGGLYCEAFDIGTSTTQYGVVFAAQSISHDDQRRMFSYSDGIDTHDASGIGNFHVSHLATRTAFTVYSGQAGANLAAESVQNGVMNVFKSRVNGADYYISKNNGTEVASNQGAPYPMTTAGAAKIGFFRTSNYISFDGYISEVVVFGAYTTDDLTAIAADIMTDQGV